MPPLLTALNARLPSRDPGGLPPDIALERWKAAEETQTFEGLLEILWVKIWIILMFLILTLSFGKGLTRNSMFQRFGGIKK